MAPLLAAIYPPTHTHIHTSPGLRGLKDVLHEQILPHHYNRIQVRALAWPFHYTNTLLPKPFSSGLPWLCKIVVLLKLSFQTHSLLFIASLLICLWKAVWAFQMGSYVLFWRKTLLPGTLCLDAVSVQGSTYWWFIKLRDLWMFLNTVYLFYNSTCGPGWNCRRSFFFFPSILFASFLQRISSDTSVLFLIR